MCAFSNAAMYVNYDTTSHPARQVKECTSWEKGWTASDKHLERGKIGHERGGRREAPGQGPRRPRDVITHP